MIGHRYELIDALGEGGIGAVYRSFDRLTRQQIAFKRLKVPGSETTTGGSANGDRLLSLAAEFRTLAALRHPHIISVIDYGFDADRQPYFTMELLTNARPITVAGRLADRATRLRYLTELLQALAYLHRRGVIHRDLKPANVLVTQDDVTKVLDFGLAQGIIPRSPNESGKFAGTLPYMAPELFLGAAATVQSDLYAAGLIAYELLAGRYPFDRTSPARLEAFLSQTPDLSEIEPPLAAVIARLLAKDPLARPPSAEAVIDDLYRALGQAPPQESEGIRESYLQASAFVGRQRDLSTLKTALQTTINGQGSAWLIGGESGVGKSRLLDELRIRALVRGVTVVRGQAVEGGGLPYQLWRDVLPHLVLSAAVSDSEAAVLRALVPNIGALLNRDIPAAPDLPGQDGRRRLAATIAALITRQPGTLLVLLEDLHWADESLAPLQHLLGALQRWARLMIVATYRSDERPALPDVLPGMERLMLERLDADDVEALAVSMLGEDARQPELVSLLQRETEGNVFFLIEVVRALAEASGRLADIAAMRLPETVFAGGVQQIVRRRLARVPDWGQRLLKVAAVIGRQVDLAVLHQITTTEADSGLLAGRSLDQWLTACANAAVLAVDEAHWRFAHDKLREALVSDLTPDETPDLHRCIAQALEAVYPHDEARAELLADHWGAAGEIDKEAYYIGRAAERMTQFTGEYASAQRLIERGLARLPAADPRRVALLNQLASAQRVLGDYAAAHQTAEAARLWAERHNDQAGLALSLNHLGHIAERQGEYTTARAAYEQSLAIRRALGDRDGIATSLNRLGSVAADLGESTAARSYFEQSLAIRREINDQRGIGTTLNNLGLVVSNQGDFSGANDYFQQSLAIQRIIGDQRGIAISLNNLGVVAATQSDYAAAEQHYQESLKLFREVGDRRGTADVLNNLGMVTADQGDYAAARDRHFQESLTLFRELGDRRGMASALVNLGLVAAALGDHPIAQACYQESLALLRAVGDRRGSATVLNEMGRISTDLGDFADADAYFQESLALHRALGDQRGIALVLASQGQRAEALGEYAAATDAYTASLALLRAIGDRQQSAYSLAGLGRSAARQGLGDQARAHFAESVAILRELGDQRGLAETLAAVAALHLDHDEIETARALLYEGLKAADTLLAAPEMVRLLAVVARWALHPHQAQRQALETRDERMQRAASYAAAVLLRTGMGQRAIRDDVARDLVPRLVLAIGQARWQQTLERGEFMPLEVIVMRALIDLAPPDQQAQLALRERLTLRRSEGHRADLELTRALVGIVRWHLNSGNTLRSAELIGLMETVQAADSDHSIHRMIDELRRVVTDKLDADTLDAALEAGRLLDLDSEITTELADLDSHSSDD
ncbi:MAG: tetratricopeptide repeat protein [Chloroflexi bacterium]|nr:tetratricopeptide repeat protein [Chloroflexota bacterium]